MINFLIGTICRWILTIRYRVELRGVDEIARRGTTGILFLPNHPALMDPIIVMTQLYHRFMPRVLADKDQVDRPFIRWISKRAGVWAIPDIREYGVQVRPQVETIITQAIEDLNQGGNLLLYPSGHTYRTRYEDLRGNSAVETVLQQVPNARVVLVRTRGLWGSSFSRASGVAPSVAVALRHGVRALLANLIVFTPKRHITVELYEPKDLPRNAGRNEINAYLEQFYNQDALPNTYVPYSIWEETSQMTLPEPEPIKLEGSAEDVPESTREIVKKYLRDLTGTQNIRDEDRLAHDLGLDSLARADLLVWLEKEFGFPGGDVDSMLTVADVILAAGGQGVIAEQKRLKPVPAKWFRGFSHELLDMPQGKTITEIFLAQAARDPGRPAIADQISGVKTYRDIVLGIIALRPLIEQLEGERVGIMLPASVAANVVYLSCLFAGKTPVFVNWTTGTRNMTHAMNMLGIKQVLTAGPLVAKIEAQGTDLSPIKDRLVMMESIGARLTRADKLTAFLCSRLSWTSLRNARVSDTAAILLTSGSEAQPKAVPLSHSNIIANLRDIFKVVDIYQDDCMIGFLPPFHSFGLTATMLLPMLAGGRAVYHANPTEAWILCRIIEAYRANLLVGTPTFLAGIIRSSRPGQLASLRISVTGAEKCPPRTYDAIAERCPNAMIIEGYGITECSPVVAANSSRGPIPYTIGQIMPSLQYALVDEETGKRVETGQPGMLLVRGPSIFSGYLNPDVASPFVEFEGKQWYRTGDLISEDENRILTFRGRLKRFVKIGGEMISLPAIEAALEPHYTSESDEGPVIAVEARGSETHPEVVLFSRRPADRATVNRQLRDAGLSPLHNISRVIQLEAIPVLGTGKTDYRTLKQFIAG